MKRSTAYFIMTLASVFWGFQPSTIKWLTEVWSPVTIAAVRYFCFGVLIIAWAYKKYGKEALPQKEHWPYLVGMGISGILFNNVLQFTGLKYTTITNCTLISSMTPSLTAVASVLVFKERLRAVTWLGIIISLAGALMIVCRGSLEVLLNLDINKGDLMAFGSQVAWMVYSILGVKVLKSFSAVATTGWAGLIGSIFTMVYGQITGQLVITALTPLPFISLLYTIFCGGIFAMVSWNMSVKVVGASVASIFLNIMPIVGMLSGYLLFAEQIGLPQLTGAAAIFLGVYLVTRRA